jgi:hypothetical protein
VTEPRHDIERLIERSSIDGADGAPMHVRRSAFASVADHPNFALALTHPVCHAVIKASRRRLGCLAVIHDIRYRSHRTFHGRWGHLRFRNSPENLCCPVYCLRFLADVRARKMQESHAEAQRRREHNELRSLRLCVRLVRGGRAAGGTGGAGVALASWPVPSEAEGFCGLATSSNHAF